MLISFRDPYSVYKIQDGVLNSITRVTSKREPTVGDCIELYYRHAYQNTVETKNKQCIVCIACVISKAVTGINCPYYDPGTYSIDARCPSFQNFLGYGRVNEVINYDNFEEIPDKEAWAENQGFYTVDAAKEYYLKLMGVMWESYPLTVISWDYLGRVRTHINR